MMTVLKTPNFLPLEMGRQLLSGKISIDALKLKLFVKNSYALQKQNDND